MNLEELKVYQLSNEIAEKTWNLVQNWDYFAKDTIGKQLIISIDSVSANLSEGFGRYFYKENKQFCYYSRGSLYESKTWIKKAYNRQLISNEDFITLEKEIELISKKLNAYIKYIGK